MRSQAISTRSSPRFSTFEVGGKEEGRRKKEEGREGGRKEGIGKKERKEKKKRRIKEVSSFFLESAV